jgi:DNA-binding response OmpR family regulator
MTLNVARQGENNARAAGRDDYVPKPFNTCQLLPKIHNFPQ